MPGIKELIENYSKIYQIIDAQGFSNGLLFKGFSDDEEHNLNIAIENKQNQSSSPSITMRLATVKEQLYTLLKCNIVIHTYKSLNENFKKKLDHTNSVKLTSEVPTDALKNCFGLNWKFNSTYFSASNPTINQSIFKSQILTETKSSNHNVKKNEKYLFEIEEKMSDLLAKEFKDAHLEKSSLEELFQNIKLKTEQKINKFESSEAIKINCKSQNQI